jgi:hypothetical protein
VSVEFLTEMIELPQPRAGFNPLAPELNPSAQRWLTRFFTGDFGSQIATHHVTIHNMPIHNILSTVPQLSISQKALRTFPEGGNVMPKHVGATIHN